MTSSATGLGRGTAAGAAGATALNVVTNLDMALRARPASSAPQELVEALVRQAGLRVPGQGREHDNRLSGLGALSGSLSGVAVGAAGGMLRASGLRLPAVLDVPLLGVAAMAASDVPMALLGVSDPRRWSASSWIMDVTFHLAYGAATHAVLVATESPESESESETSPRSATGLCRAAGIGAATGGRSSAGVTAVALSSDPRTTSGMAAKLGSRAGKAVTTLLFAGELVLDKLPQAPPRLAALGMGMRVVNGAGSAAALAQRHHTNVPLATAIGAAGAAAASWGGQRWRAVAPRWCGSPVPAALLEDGVVVTLAALAARGETSRHRRRNS